MRDTKDTTPLQRLCARLEQDLAMFAKVKELYNIEFTLEKHRIKSQLNGLRGQGQQAQQEA